MGRVHRSIAVLVVGGVLGGIAVLGDGLVPWRLIGLVGNLAAPWVVGALVLGTLTRAPRGGAVTATLGLVVGCVVYYVANGFVRGQEWPWDLSGARAAFVWLVVSLVVGPVVGACGGFVAVDRAPVVRAAVPAGAVLGEAVWFVVERRLWLIDLVSEPFRVIDLVLVMTLVVLSATIVVRAGDRRHRDPTLGLTVVSAGLTLTSLWLIRSGLAA